MTDTNQQTSYRRVESSFPEDEPGYDAEPTVEYTVAFIPDSRASTLALAETVKQLVVSRSISRAIVELNTDAGTVIAAELRSQGLPYDVMVFDNAGSGADDDPQSEASRLHAAAATHVPVSAEGLHMLDANYVVIPALQGSGQKRIDLAVDRDTHIDISETTLPGHLLKNIEAETQQSSVAREVLFVDTPERGLVQEADGTYQRRVLHIGFGDEETPQ